MDEQREQEVFETMMTMGTGPCECGGEFNAFGRCNKCGAVD